ncbi:MAG: LacI family DNA-binding transcriptional regulator [Spirochaetales bacterium]|nr:LacI family DNA-binding transcriptional regulator [Spirochaetales bacterium]
MKITIKDIARMARVSKGSVSKALNGQPGVGEKTRQRILKLVEQTGYEPNFLAQALAFSKTGNIGLIIPHEAGYSLNGSYWSELITAIAQESNSCGYSLLLLTARHEGDIESAYRTVLKSRRIDGLIIGSEMLDKKSIKALMSHDIPFVLIGKNPQVKHYFVDTDNYQGAYQIIEYMVRHGYKRPAVISGPEEYYYTRERMRGAVDALKAAGADSTGIFSTIYDTASVFECVNGIMKEFRPDSLFVSSGGEFLFDVLQALNSFHVQYPKFGITVFDDFRFLDFIYPKITAVSQPIQEIGNKAMKILYALMNNQSPDKYENILKTTITSRESCGE